MAANDFCEPTARAYPDNAWLDNSEKRVLNHGFVRAVDAMGNDASVVQAARVSYGKDVKGYDEDRALIRYLMRAGHTTPFEMCEIKLHVKLPIFVARQWIRHRTGSFNEYSMRYSPAKDEFFVPDPETVKPQSSTNKQGREDSHILHPDYGRESAREIEGSNNTAFESYNELTYDNSRIGYPPVARELARVVLPLSTYTEWYWKTDLHNLMHFLRLRLDSHAQYEIRVYAEAIAEIVKEWVPICWEAFQDYRLDAVTFSRMEMKVLRDFLKMSPALSETLTLPHDKWPDIGLTERETREFKEKLRG